jgi:hypothetical protein
MGLEERREIWDSFGYFVGPTLPTGKFNVTWTLRLNSLGGVDMVGVASI